MLTRLVELAREHGYHKMVLSAFPTNAGGMALYTKHGFRTVGIYKDSAAAGVALKELEHALEHLRKGDPNQDIVESQNLSFSQSGNTITMTATLKLEKVIEGINKGEEPIK